MQAVLVGRRRSGAFLLCTALFSRSLRWDTDPKRIAAVDWAGGTIDQLAKFTARAGQRRGWSVIVRRIWMKRSGRGLRVLAVHCGLALALVSSATSHSCR